MSGVNLDLLERTMQHIEAEVARAGFDPADTTFAGDWYQGCFCGTGCCFAGTACVLDGSLDARAHEAFDIVNGEDFGVTVFDHAKSLLGLPDDIYEELVFGGNTCADLRRIVNAIKFHVGEGSLS